MITQLKFKEDYFCFFKNQKFILKPITLLTGDQGCGKSTLLTAISQAVKKEETNCIEIVTEEPLQENILKLDLEVDNPRIGYANPNDSQGMFYALTSKFRSHGEVLLPILKHIQNVSNSIILIDEPETSLSLRSQFEMIEILKTVQTRENQIIIATHNFIFMEAFPDSILSLEQNKYVKPKKFKKLQMLPSDFKEKRDDKIIKKTKCKKGNNCTCANETGWYNNKCESYIKRR